MRLLTRVTHAITARWGPGPRAQEKTPEELRALAGMDDEAVLACLKPEISGRDTAALLAYYRARRMPSPLFRPSDRKELARLVAECFPESYKETLRRADLACRHVVEVLGSGPTDLGDPINWWTDFKGGTWAQGDYQELNATLYANDFQNDRYIGDIKLPWELNKHAHLLELAKAYWLTGDERYAEALLAQMDDWIARNPFLYGIAWTQNLIVAQRAIAWTLAIQAVWQSPAFTPARLLRLLRALYQHARYIPAHFEFAERASNHLFGNAAGLAAIALVFPEFCDAETWRATALWTIESELAKQVYPDGVHYEQSVNYHRYVVEFCLLPWLLTWPQPLPYSAAARAALRRMMTFLLHMTQPNGQVQPISDADGTRVWRFNGRSMNDHRGVLNLGAVLFKDGALKFGMDGNREDLLWWLGPEVYREWEALRAEEPPRSVAFPKGGYFVLRETWGPEALWVFFDCGHVGMGDWPDEVSEGTHGHSDLLTFGLAAGGETFLTDLGSYTYTGSRPWHDYFRSAQGHNVLLVDGQDQSVLTTTWAMRERARPREVAWQFSPDIDFVTGAHDGYRRLSPPVLHRRSLLLLRAERRVIIRDDLEGEGDHTVEALFHAMPAVRVLQADRPDSWKLIGQRASVTITFLAESLRQGQPLPLAYRVAKGATSPIDGWYAEDYGVKEPAPVLHVSFRGPCPLRLYTVLQLDAPGRADAPGAWSTYRGADAAWDAAVKSLGLSREMTMPLSVGKRHISGCLLSDKAFPESFPATLKIRLRMKKRVDIHMEDRTACRSTTLFHSSTSYLYLDSDTVWGERYLLDGKSVRNYGYSSNPRKQALFVIPRFTDEAFALTVSYKDMSSEPVWLSVYDKQQGYIPLGQLEGKKDGRWKETTFVVPAGIRPTREGFFFNLHGELTSQDNLYAIARIYVSGGRAHCLEGTVGAARAEEQEHCLFFSFPIETPVGSDCEWLLEFSSQEAIDHRVHVHLWDGESFFFVDLLPALEPYDLCVKIPAWWISQYLGKLGTDQAAMMAIDDRNHELDLLKQELLRKQSELAQAQKLLNSRLIRQAVRIKQWLKRVLRRTP